MHVARLELLDFRNYERAELELAPGPHVLVGSNGQGKTNLVEAIGYVATLSSHRVAQDQPLVRFGADRAVVRAAVVREGREQVVELVVVRHGRPPGGRRGRRAARRARRGRGTGGP